MSRTGWILVFISAGLTVIANLMLRCGVDAAGGFSLDPGRILTGLKNLILQRAFCVGIISYGLASLVWFKVLSTEQLSVAYPVLVSSTFFFVSLSAVFVFREPLNFLKITGLLVILSGIIIVAQS